MLEVLPKSAIILPIGRKVKVTVAFLYLLAFSLYGGLIFAIVYAFSYFVSDIFLVMELVHVISTVLATFVAILATKRFARNHFFPRNWPAIITAILFSIQFLIPILFSDLKPTEYYLTDFLNYAGFFICTWFTFTIFLQKYYPPSHLHNPNTRYTANDYARMNTAATQKAGEFDPKNYRQERERYNSLSSNAFAAQNSTESLPYKSAFIVSCIIIAALLFVIAYLFFISF